MKKIMFNEPYGLHAATLYGSKTMTRRIVPQKIINAVPAYQEMYYAQTLEHISVEDAIMNMIGPEHMFNCAYKIGEVIAVAQSYRSIMMDDSLQDFRLETDFERIVSGWVYPNLKIASEKGYNNKMYVKAELMPRQIEITDRKVERLHDISKEDCLKEGIYYDEKGGCIVGIPFYYTFHGAINKRGKQLYYTTPKGAFADLIDRISGNNIWFDNPYVFAYTYKRIR